MSKNETRNRRVEAITDRVAWQDGRGILTNDSLLISLIDMLGELVNSVDNLALEVKNKSMYSGV